MSYEWFWKNPTSGYFVCQNCGAKFEERVEESQTKWHNCDWPTTVGIGKLIGLRYRIPCLEIKSTYVKDGQTKVVVDAPAGLRELRHMTSNVFQDTVSDDYYKIWSVEPFSDTEVLLGVHKLRTGDRVK